MSQLGKVLLRVVMNRLRGKFNERVLEEQYGFRKGKGTNNAIFALRMIIERSIEMQTTVFLCFVDSEKAFDTVKHDELVNSLESTGMDGKDTRLIGNLYWNQKQWRIQTFATFADANVRFSENFLHTRK